MLPLRGVVSVDAVAARAHSVDSCSVVVVVNDDIALLALPTVRRRNSTARGGVRIMPSRSATGQFWRAPTMGAEALGVGASFLPGGGMVIGGGIHTIIGRCHHCDNV